MKKIKIAISPCPNDTFVFYALINKKITVENLEFEFSFLDIEQLNMGALNHEFDICKVSYALIPQLTHNYNLLSAGGALGKKCGPLLITHHHSPFQIDGNHNVVLPGKHTTAAFLFNHFYPNNKKMNNHVFSSIEDSLVQKQFDAGVIIHESRFTYGEKGLFLVADLGEKWETKYHLPIPLGGIIIDNKMDINVQKQINNAIKLSVDYAWEHKEEVLDFCKSYAQEMSESVMLDHIHLYVNEFTSSLNIEGKAAIEKLFLAHENENSCNFMTSIVFIE